MTRQMLGRLALVLVLPLAFIVIDAVAGVGAYWQHLAVLSAVYVILASSLNLLTGYSGLVSLGHVAFFGIGAYTTGLVTVHLEWSVPAGFAAALVAAFIAGHLIARVALRLRGASFVIATLAVAEGFRLVATNWQSATGGPAGLIGVPPLSIFGVELLTADQVYPVLFGVTILIVILIARIVESRIGANLLAMRDHELLAQALGIDPVASARTAFVIGGVIAAFGGAVYAHYIGFISPDVFAFSLMTTILLMVVAGGLGTIVGPVIGGVVFTLLPEALRFSDQWRLVIYGTLLLLIVRFLPGGIWGTVLDGSRWVRGRFATGTDVAGELPPLPAAREAKAVGKGQES